MQIGTPFMTSWVSRLPAENMAPLLLCDFELDAARSSCCGTFCCGPVAGQDQRRRSRGFIAGFAFP